MARAVVRKRSKPGTDLQTVKILKAFRSTLPKYVNEMHTRSNVTPIVIPAGYKVKMGFEIECFVNAEQTTISKSLQAIVKEPVIRSPEIQRNIENIWRVHSDGSLRITNGDNWTVSYLYDKELRDLRNLRAIEISSAALDWNKSWKALIKVIRMLQKYNGYTNSTCGLHMSVSIWKKVKGKYVNVSRNFTYTNLSEYLKLYESEITDIWGRSDNEYCVPIRNSVAYAMHKYTKSNMVPDSTTPEQLYPASYGIGSKYQTFNLSKLHVNNSSPYIECRIAGNTNCHLRLLDAYYTIGSFSQMLLDSISKATKKHLL